MELSIITNYLPIGFVGTLLFILCLELWHFLQKEHSTLLQQCFLLLLGCYLSWLFAMTISPIYGWSLSNLGQQINFIPGTVLQTITSNPVNFWGNIVVFIPVGTLFVLCSQHCRKIYVSLLYGALLSLLIELLQLFEVRGTDIDDIILNTFGTLIGYLLGQCLIALFPALRRQIGVSRVVRNKLRKKKKDTGRLTLLICTICAVIFCTGFIKQESSMSADSLMSKSEFADLIPQEASVTPTASATPIPAEDKLSLIVEARNAYVLNCNSQTVLYEKNATDSIAPASTTKLLTALTVLDYCSLDATVTIGEEINLVAPDASTAWLCIGDELTVNQLLVALLFPSGNDAAYALAAYTGRIISDHTEASTDQALSTFMEAMNRKAESLGATHSCFVCPDGYDTPGHTSTVTDLACIASACLQNDTICQIAGSYEITNTWSNGQSATYNNTNELLNPSSEYYCPEVIGLKTGRSTEAGNCLISAAVIHQQTYLVIIMNSSENGRWTDSLLAYDAIRQRT